MFYYLYNICKRRTLRHQLASVGAGTRHWSKTLHSQRDIELFSDVGMDGEIEGALKKVSGCFLAREMEVPGCRSRAMAMNSIMFVVLNSSLRVRINESKQLKFDGG